MLGDLGCSWSKVSMVVLGLCTLPTELQIMRLVGGCTSSAQGGFANPYIRACIPSVLIQQVLIYLVSIVATSCCLRVWTMAPHALPQHFWFIYFFLHVQGFLAYTSTSAWATCCWCFRVIGIKAS